MTAAESPPVVSLVLKVVPGASSNAIAGWLGNELKVRVRAPPERGKANVAVKKLIAKKLGLPDAAVTIVGGHRNARKRLEIVGLEEFAIWKKLGKPAHE